MSCALHVEESQRTNIPLLASETDRSVCSSLLDPAADIVCGGPGVLKEDEYEGA